MGPKLTIDLAAIAANYRLLKERFTGGKCAAVVKADAYGLGVKEVSKKLSESGCGMFFVATLEEGVELRETLPEAEIFVFHGPYPGEEKDYAHARLTPVLNSEAQLKRWPVEAPFALHVDTGMNRLGFAPTEWERLAPTLAARPVRLLMSHLACANEKDHPKNAGQLARFRAARALLPGVPASLCNSSGIFLNPGFHFDVARPGCALYGIAPVEGENPMRAVATLAVPILQIRTLEEAGTVGYGATFAAPKGARIAIAQLGYADGWLRALSNIGHAYVAGQRVPLAGRVSMDMIALDVSAVSESLLARASVAEVLNAEQTVNDVARDAATIGYEIFTRLGARVRRAYGTQAR